MEVRAHQAVGVHLNTPLTDLPRQARKEEAHVATGFEEGAPGEPPVDDVVPAPGLVFSGFAGHACKTPGEHEGTGLCGSFLSKGGGGVCGSVLRGTQVIEGATIDMSAKNTRWFLLKNEWNLTDAEEIGLEGLKEADQNLHRSSCVCVAAGCMSRQRFLGRQAPTKAAGETVFFILPTTTSCTVGMRER